LISSARRTGGGPTIARVGGLVFDIPSIRIGKILGIPFEINLSWIAIFALVAFTLTTSYYPGLPVAEGAPQWLLWVMGTTTSLLFFASILAHELSHAVVTRLEGGRVDKITLFLFGGVAQIQDEPRTPGRELLMASSGPIMSILLAGLCYLAFLVLRANGAPWWIWAQLQYLATINLFVGVFNLLPGFPLDGGRVLRSILWAITGDILTATRWAARSGQGIGWTMVVISVAATLSGISGFLWFGLVGWFIAWLAGAAYRQQQVKSVVSGVTVGQIMTPHPEYVDGAITVETFVQGHLLGRQHSRYPVMFEGAIVGVVSLPDIKTVAKPDWPYVRLLDVTNRDLSQVSVDASTPVDALLEQLAADKPGALLVVHEGRLAGIVTRSDVIALLQSASQHDRRPQ
jgi:Zn-dependent protease/predicted transcriptional regulator